MHAILNINDGRYGIHGISFCRSHSLCARNSKMNLRVAINCSSSLCTPGKVNVRIQQFEPASIPKIDLGGLNPSIKTRSLAIEDIGNACQKLGYFQVINHGISRSVIDGAMEAASGFFALPREEKAEFESEDVYQPVRYSGCSQHERILKPRDFLKQYAHPLGEWIRFWPHSPPDYREKMGRYAVDIRRVALQLTDAILESLGLGPGCMRRKIEEGMQVMTLNNYERCPYTAGPALGLAPHSDYGCITILLQSCEGLQITGKDAWQAVPLESPRALHVHIGDHLEVLSNGRYKSVVHRVVLDSRKRVSIASIHGLSMDEVVTAAKELVDDRHPNGYRGSSFRDVLDYISKNDFTKGCSFIDSLRIVSP